MPNDASLVGGIIPACAGSTRSAAWWSRWSRDHPRMRGEHTGRLSELSATQGSSPHARGARVAPQRPDISRGIIPACAGSTRPRRCGRRASRDHPRMRGEHIFNQPVQTPDEGSSPHARGAHLRPEARRVDRGIIPACAGSTSPCPRRASCCRDHPRMRGEHAVCLGGGKLAEGSSPHARGARGERHVLVEVEGIIPACAGSTWPPR